MNKKLKTMIVAINSTTSSNVTTKEIDGVKHLVTEMIPIVGNSVMNGGLYPDGQLDSSYMQLNDKLTPNGHPVVNGEPVSAFHPAAINAQNIGGFMRNAKKHGKVVSIEFWLNTEVAEKSEDGIELMKRMNNSEAVGVSTGLTLKQAFTNGVQDGIDYEWVASDFKFDHCAILLNEEAAGADYGTALKYNSKDGEKTVMVVNDSHRNTMNQLFMALRKESHNFFLDDLDNENKKAIIENERGELFARPFEISEGVAKFSSTEMKPVVKSVTFKETESGMVNSKIVKKVIPMDIEEAMKLCKAKGFTVNKTDVEKEKDSDFYQTNKERITSLIAADDKEVNDLRVSVVANSELTVDDVANMNTASLMTINKMVSKDAETKTDYSVTAGTTGETTKTNTKEKKGFDFANPDSFAKEA